MGYHRGNDECVGVFHHSIAKIIMGKMSCRIGEEGWEWPPSEEAIESVGLWPMWEYVQRQRLTIVEYISTCPIFDLFTGAE